MPLSPAEALPFDARGVVVVGGGQAALAVGYHLARELRGADATVAILDDQPAPGGAWQRGWDSLRLFSPATSSSLPGYLFPRHLAGRNAEAADFPHRDDVLDYHGAYEARYELPVWRPVRVTGVQRTDEALLVETHRGAVSARAVVAATGTAAAPFIPDVPGRDSFRGVQVHSFRGVQVHSSAYRSPAAFAGRYLCPPEAPGLPEASGNDYADATATAEIGASGFRTELSARGFASVADEPAASGGTETGPTPYDLLGQALAACTAMTLRMVADRKGLPLTGVGVAVTHTRVHAADCARCESEDGFVSRLTRTIRLDGDLTGEARHRLIEIADRCPVHRTLEGEIEVVTVESGA